MDKAVRFVQTFLAVLTVDSFVPEPDGHALNRPLFAARVEHGGHGNTTAQRAEQDRIRIGTHTVAARAYRFIRAKRFALAVSNFVLQVRQGSDCYLAHS